MAYKAVIAVLIAALAVVGGCIVYNNMIDKQDPVTPEPEEPEETYYSITYVLNGGTADPMSPASYKSGERTYLGTPTKTISGYSVEFLGWYSDSALTQRIGYISESATGDKTVYAKWDDSELSVWNIEYELNGGTAVSTLTTQYVEGMVTPLGTLVKVEDFVSFKFKGWSLSEDMSEVITEIGEDMTGDIKLYASWARPDDSQYYSIKYVLNGGTADSSSPSSYYVGKVTDLGCPTKVIDVENEYLFMGWYLDAACTQSIMYIPAQMIGDLTLFASWDTDVVGHGFKFDTVTTTTETWFGQKYTSVSYGTFAYTYLHYDEKDGYLQMRVTGTMLKDGSYSYRETVEWQSDDEVVEESDYESGVVIDIGGWKPVTEKVTVTLYKGAYKETQYYIYGWLLVKLESSYQSYSTVQTTEYTLTDLLTHESQPTYTVKAYSDKGLTVSGAGTYDAFTRNVVLTVVGDDSDFAGWYDEDGKLLSTKTTYVISLVLSDIAVYAMNTSDNDYVAQKDKAFTMTPEVSLKGTEWILKDGSGVEIARTVSESFSYTFTECGTYSISYSGQDGNGVTVSKIGSIMVDGIVTKVYEWSYGDESYTAQLDIQYSDYVEYVNADVKRFQYSPEDDVKYVTYNDKYVKSLAGQIAVQTQGMSVNDTVTVLLRFVQTIPYVTDSESRGMTEYFKFPLETLYDNGGDCEDTTFLFCAIGKAMGYDVAVMYFEGHAAGAINMKELGYGSDNVGIEKVRGNFGSYSYYVLEENSVVLTYLYPDDVRYNGTPKEFYLFCETTTVSDKYGNTFDIGDVPLYKSYGVGDNPYSSLNVQNVIPVV